MFADWRLVTAAGLVAACLLAATITYAAPDNVPAAGDGTYSLDFDVFLDDSKIGFHHYEFSDSESGREVRS